MNPVLVKEFRTRMRGGRAYGVLLGYTLLLTLLMAGTYLQWISSAQSQGGMLPGRTFFDAGRMLYLTLFVSQALMVSVITPAVTAGAISLEREQRTLEMVALSLLRPRDLVLGKLAAAVAFVTLLLTASLPLVSLSFLLGGVSPAELFGTYLCNAVVALLFAAVGIFWSSTLPTTAASTAATYASVGTFFIVTVIPLTAAASMAGSPFRSLNPIGAVFYSVSEETFFRTSLPSWLPAVLLNLCLAALAVNLAMTRLEHYRESRPIPIRLLATAAWCLLVLWTVGAAVGNPSVGWTIPNNARYYVAFLVGLGLAVFLLILPIFATGESAALSPRSYLAGMLPHRFLAGDLPSGVPLLASWLGAALLLLACGIAIMGHGRRAALWELLPPFAILVFAVAAAFVALGHLLSVAMSGRWAALAMTYVAILAFTAVPAVLIPANADPTIVPGAEINALYLTPFTGLMEWASLQREPLPEPWIHALWFGRTPFWIVTALLYSVLPVGLGATTLMLLRRRGKRLDAKTLDARL